MTRQPPPPFAETQIVEWLTVADVAGSAGLIVHSRAGRRGAARIAAAKVEQAFAAPRAG